MEQQRYGVFFRGCRRLDLNLGPCLLLVLKCILGERITSDQLRRIAVYTCIYLASLRCPAAHLCSDFVTVYVASPRRSRCPPHSYCIRSVTDKTQSCLAWSDNLDGPISLYDSTLFHFASVHQKSATFLDVVDMAFGLYL